MSSNRTQTGSPRAPVAARSPLVDDEIDYHPLSFADSSGSRLFHWRKGLYRGIPAPHAAFYGELFERGVVGDLVSRGLLIETTRTELVHAQFPLVVEHAELPFVSYAFEWSAPMLRDAGLLVSDLAIRCGELGLAFTDATWWNVLFYESRPVFVDFSSIEAPGWAGAAQEYEHNFRSSFIEPAELFARGYVRVARLLMADYDHLAVEEFARMLGFPSDAVHSSTLRARVRSRLARVLQSRGADATTLQAHRLRRELERVSLEDPPRSGASGREASVLDDETGRILERLAPKSVIDLGCGRGRHARLAAETGAQVVAIDIDEQAVASCYREAREHNRAILPLVVNLRSPSPALGICNRGLASAFERLASDMALALGLVHELALEQHLRLDQIAETLARFSGRWLLVDFVDGAELPEHLLGASEARDYGLDRFVAFLSPWFETVTPISLESANHVLLLCEKQ